MASMTDQEILEKAIQKAIDGGFRWPMIWPGLLSAKYRVEILGGDADIAFYGDSFTPNPWTMSWEKLIFNHDFAKALWGNNPKPYAQVWTRVNPGRDVEWAVENGELNAWQWNLMQMVIADDPIKYLGDNL